MDRITAPSTAVAGATSPESTQTDDESPDLASLLKGPRDGTGSSQTAGGQTRSIQPGANSDLKFVWNGLSDSVRTSGVLSAMSSNIRKVDYVGAETCKECHPKNYEHWLHHSHRLMNALATDETVRGDFSGEHPMHYLGGEVTFRQEKGRRFMTFVRAGVSRTYQIVRTIGSRFTQYYTGILVDGPEPGDHPSRKIDQVLAVGWWIDRQEWIPAVHVDREGPDGTRWDPFAKVSDISYDGGCSACHNTTAIGDWIIDPTGGTRMGYFTPVPVVFDVKSYLTQAHPDLASAWAGSRSPDKSGRLKIIQTIQDESVVANAVNLGISCEECHNGCEEHVRASDKHKSAVLPQFFPTSASLVALGGNAHQLYDRNPRSVNFICARCHSGGRPYFADGAATWNSVEYSDAEAGSCYVRKRHDHADQDILSCNVCHDPHVGIGSHWQKTPDEDDEACLKCHQKYRAATPRFQHTRHPAGTPGARCLNCHMPKIDEGLEDVVRTHMITSPNRKSMIEANQPNACNLCHLDKPIDWTITWFSRWYNQNRYTSYDTAKLKANYPDLDGPVGLGWLKSSHESTRLVAVSALAREKAAWALPQMIKALDDPYLLNRQFARIALENWLGVRLADYGYQFYQTPDERRTPVTKIEHALLKPAARD